MEGDSLTFRGGGSLSQWPADFEKADLRVPKFTLQGVFFLHLCKHSMKHIICHMLLHDDQKNDLCRAAYGGVVLQHFDFIKFCMRM